MAWLTDAQADGPQGGIGLHTLKQLAQALKWVGL